METVLLEAPIVQQVALDSALTLEAVLDTELGQLVTLSAPITTIVAVETALDLEDA